MKNAKVPLNPPTSLAKNFNKLKHSNNAKYRDLLPLLMSTSYVEQELPQRGAENKKVKHLLDPRWWTPPLVEQRWSHQHSGVGSENSNTAITTAINADFYHSEKPLKGLRKSASPSMICCFIHPSLGNTLTSRLWTRLASMSYLEQLPTGDRSNFTQLHSKSIQVHFHGCFWSTFHFQRDSSVKGRLSAGREG